jgi:hypothetical protein
MGVGSASGRRHLGLAERRTAVGGAAAVAGLAVGLGVGAAWSTDVLAAWDAAALMYLGLVWPAIVTANPAATARLARDEEGSPSLGKRSARSSTGRRPCGRRPRGRSAERAAWGAAGVHDAVAALGAALLRSPCRHARRRIQAAALMKVAVLAHGVIVGVGRANARRRTA